MTSMTQDGIEDLARIGARLMKEARPGPLTDEQAAYLYVLCELSEEGLHQIATLAQRYYRTATKAI